MAGFITKIIVCPIGVLVANFLGFVSFSFWQAVGVGLAVALVGYIMERAILRSGTVWLSTIADFVMATAVVYFSQYFFANAYATFWGSVGTGLILAAVEYIQHHYLVASGRTSD